MHSHANMRILATALSLALALPITACGSAGTSNTSASTGASVSSASTAATTQATENNTSRRLIIDTDTGADDASAIILAALDKNVGIEGVTVLAGNTDLEQATKNALAALEVAGAEAPVYKGSASTYDGVEQTVFSVFGTDGMGDAGLVNPKGKAQEGDAVDFILETVKNNPGEIEIVCLGPATNIAKAIERDPATMAKAKMIWSMGSAGLGHGNASPVAEFNVYKDAKAYKVLLDSGLPITVVGLDMCRDDAMWSEEQFTELGKQGTVGKFVADSFGKLREFYAANGETATSDCDALAMMCVLDPSFVKSTEQCHGSCITDDKSEAYGEVIYYQEGFTYDATLDRELDYNVKLVTGVDQAAYFANYLAAIK